MWSMLSGKSADKSNKSSSSRRQDDDAASVKTSGSRRRKDRSDKSVGDDDAESPRETRKRSSTSAKSSSRGDARDRGLDDGSEPNGTPSRSRTDSISHKSTKSRSDDRYDDENRQRRKSKGEKSSTRDRSPTPERTSARSGRKDSYRDGDEKDRSNKRASTDPYGSSSRSLPPETSRAAFDTPSSGGPGLDSQFPGQFNATMPGMPGGSERYDNGQAQHSNSFSSVPNQFPGQFPSGHTSPFRPPNSATEGGWGLASEYYNDQGESVHNQPGARPGTPIIVGTQPHLRPAGAAANPPPEPSSSGGVGAAASFYSGADFGGTPDRPSKPSEASSARPGRVSSGNGASGRPPSSSLPAGAAVAAAGAAAGYYMSGAQQSSSQSYSHSSANQQYSSNSTSGLNPPRPGSDRPSSYYTANGSGPQSDRPAQGTSSSHHSNIPLYAAAAAAGAAGLAAYEHHEHSQHQHQTEASSGAQYGVSDEFSKPPPGFHYVSDHHQSGYASGGGGGYISGGGAGGGAVGMSQQHRHRGPIARFVDFFRDPEGVAQFEEYTQYIGVCRYCFDPRSSPRDAPRKHYYGRSRRSWEKLNRSRESLHSKKSWEKMNGSRTSIDRVDKQSRYATGDRRLSGSRVDVRTSEHESARRTSSGGFLTGAIAGAAAGAVAEKLTKRKENFDDTYSVKSGRLPEGYTAEQHQRRRRLSPTDGDRPSRSVSYGVTSDTRKSERRDSKTEHREGTGEIIGGGRDGRPARRSSIKDSNISTEKRRSSKEWESERRDERRSNGLVDAAIGAGIGAGVGALAASSRRPDERRSDVRTSDQKRRGSVSSNESARKRKLKRKTSRPGIFGGLFGGSSSKSSTKSRKSSSDRKHKEKQSGFFGFSNASHSSTDSALILEEDLRTSKGSSNRKSTRNKRSSPPGIKSDSEARDALRKLARDTTALTALSATSDRGPKNGSVVAVRDKRGGQLKGPHSIYDPGTRTSGAYQDPDEAVWEDASEDDEESIDMGLTYGGSALDLRHKSSHDSDASVSDKWGWRWGGKKKRESPSPPRFRPPEHVHTPTAAKFGIGASAVAVGAAAYELSKERKQGQSFASSQSSLPPMQVLDPMPASEATSYSEVPKYSSVRPGPVPLQQPQPVSPLKNGILDPSRMPGEFPADDHRGVVARNEGWAATKQERDGIRRTNSSPPRLRNDELSQVRFNFTDEQRERHDRDDLIEREKEEAKYRVEAPDGIKYVEPERTRKKIRRSEKEEKQRKRDEEAAAIAASAAKNRQDIADIDRRLAELKRESDDEKPHKQLREYAEDTRQSKRNGSSVTDAALIGIAGAAVGGVIGSMNRSKDKERTSEFQAGTRRADARKDRPDDYRETGFEGEDQPNVWDSRYNEVSEKGERRRQRQDELRQQYPDDAQYHAKIDDLPKQARRSKDSDPVDLTQEELASAGLSRITKKAADLVRRSPSPATRHESYADFFTPEEELKKPAGYKQRASDPDADNDIQVYNVRTNSAGAEETEQPNIMTIEPKADMPDRSISPWSYPPDATFHVDTSHLQLGYKVPDVNLIRPTPIGSPLIVPIEPKDNYSPVEEPEEQVHERDRQQTESSTKGNKVTFGDNRTHHYDPHTPESEHGEFVRDAATATAGVAAAGAATYYAQRRANGGGDDQEARSRREGKRDSIQESVPYPSPKPAEPEETADEELSRTELEREDREWRQTHEFPGGFGAEDEEDIDFTAHVAAGLESSGFDPNIVIDDANFRRRESPPGSGDELSRERRQTRGTSQIREETSERRRADRGPSPIEQIFGIRRDSPGTEGAPPVQGFVESESVAATPADELKKTLSRSSTLEQEKEGKKSSAFSRAASDINMPRNDAFAAGVTAVGAGASADSEALEAGDDEFAASSSKKKKDKKKGKKDRRQSVDVEPPIEDAPLAREDETQTSRTGDEPFESSVRERNHFDDDTVTGPVADQEQDEDWSKLTKKERKRREKEAKRKTVEVGGDSMTGEEPFEPSMQDRNQFDEDIVAEPMAEHEPENDWSNLTKKERKRREKEAKRKSMEASGEPEADNFTTATNIATGLADAAVGGAAAGYAADESQSREEKRSEKQEGPELSREIQPDKWDEWDTTRNGSNKKEKKSKRSSEQFQEEGARHDTVRAAGEGEYDDDQAELDIINDAAREPEEDFESDRQQSESKARKNTRALFEKAITHNDAAYDIINDAADPEPSLKDIVEQAKRAGKGKGADQEDIRAESPQESQSRDEFFDAEAQAEEGMVATPTRARSLSRDGDGTPSAAGVPLPNESEVATPTYERLARSQEFPGAAHEDDDDARSEFSVAATAIGAGDSERKKKKKKRRSTTYDDDDAASVTSAPVRQSSSSSKDKDKSSPKDEKKKGGIFGLFSKKLDDAAEKRRAREEAERVEIEEQERKERKKKHRRSRDGASIYGSDEESRSAAARSRNASDDDAKSTRSGSRGERHREHRSSSRHAKDKYEDRDLPAKRSDDFHDAASTTRLVPDEEGDEPSTLRDQDKRQQSFLGERPAKSKPPDHGNEEAKQEAELESEQRHAKPSGSSLAGLGLEAGAIGAAALASGALPAAEKDLVGRAEEEQRQRDQPAQAPSRESNRTQDDLDISSVQGTGEDEAASSSWNAPAVTPSRPQGRRAQSVVQVGPYQVSQSPWQVQYGDVPHSVSTTQANTASPTAVPLVFRRRPPVARAGSIAQSTPPKQQEPQQQTGLSAAALSAAASPNIPTTPGRGEKRDKRPNSTEFKGKADVRPLYLVERHRKPTTSFDPEEELPALPDSEATSRASSVHDDGSVVGSPNREESSSVVDREIADVFARPPSAGTSASSKFTGLGLDLTAARNYRPEDHQAGTGVTGAEYLSSSQATPTAATVKAAERAERAERAMRERALLEAATQQHMADEMVWEVRNRKSSNVSASSAVMSAHRPSVSSVSMVSAASGLNTLETPMEEEEAQQLPSRPDSRSSMVVAYHEEDKSQDGDPFYIPPYKGESREPSDAAIQDRKDQSEHETHGDGLALGLGAAALAGGAALLAHGASEHVASEHAASEHAAADKRDALDPEKPIESTRLEPLAQNIQPNLEETSATDPKSEQEVPKEQATTTAAQSVEQDPEDERASSKPGKKGKKSKKAKKNRQSTTPEDLLEPEAEKAKEQETLAMAEHEAETEAEAQAPAAQNQEEIQPSEAPPQENQDDSIIEASREAGPISSEQSADQSKAEEALTAGAFAGVTSGTFIDSAKTDDNEDPREQPSSPIDQFHEAFEEASGPAQETIPEEELALKATDATEGLAKDEEPILPATIETAKEEDEWEGPQKPKKTKKGKKNRRQSQQVEEEATAPTTELPAETPTAEQAPVPDNDYFPQSEQLIEKSAAETLAIEDELPSLANKSTEELVADIEGFKKPEVTLEEASALADEPIVAFTQPEEPADDEEWIASSGSKKNKKARKGKNRSVQESFPEPPVDEENLEREAARSTQEQAGSSAQEMLEDVPEAAAANLPETPKETISEAPADAASAGLEQKPDEEWSAPAKTKKKDRKGKKSRKSAGDDWEELKPAAEATTETPNEKQAEDMDALIDEDPPREADGGVSIEQTELAPEPRLPTPEPTQEPEQLPDDEWGPMPGKKKGKNKKSNRKSLNTSLPEPEPSELEQKPTELDEGASAELVDTAVGTALASSALAPEELGKDDHTEATTEAATEKGTELASDEAAFEPQNFKSEPAAEQDPGEDDWTSTPLTKGKKKKKQKGKKSSVEEPTPETPSATSESEGTKTVTSDEIIAAPTDEQDPAVASDIVDPTESNLETAKEPSAEDEWATPASKGKKKKSKKDKKSQDSEPETPIEAAVELPPLDDSQDTVPEANKEAQEVQTENTMTEKELKANEESGTITEDTVDPPSEKELMASIESGTITDEPLTEEPEGDAAASTPVEESRSEAEAPVAEDEWAPAPSGKKKKKGSKKARKNSISGEASVGDEAESAKDVPEDAMPPQQEKDLAETPELIETYAEDQNDELGAMPTITPTVSGETLLPALKRKDSKKRGHRVSWPAEHELVSEHEISAPPSGIATPAELSIAIPAPLRTVVPPGTTSDQLPSPSWDISPTNTRDDQDEWSFGKKKKKKGEDASPSPETETPPEQPAQPKLKSEEAGKVEVKEEPEVDVWPSNMKDGGKGKDASAALESEALSEPEFPQDEAPAPEAERSVEPMDIDTPAAAEQGTETQPDDEWSFPTKKPKKGKKDKKGKKSKDVSVSQAEPDAVDRETPVGPEATIDRGEEMEDIMQGEDSETKDKEAKLGEASVEGQQILQQGATQADETEQAPLESQPDNESALSAPKKSRKGKRGKKDKMATLSEGPNPEPELEPEPQLDVPEDAAPAESTSMEAAFDETPDAKEEAAEPVLSDILSQEQQKNTEATSERVDTDSLVPQQVMEQIPGEIPEEPKEEDWPTASTKKNRKTKKGKKAKPTSFDDVEPEPLQALAAESSEQATLTEEPESLETEGIANAPVPEVLEAAEDEWAVQPKKNKKKKQKGSRSETLEESAEPAQMQEEAKDEQQVNAVITESETPPPEDAVMAEEPIDPFLANEMEQAAPLNKKVSEEASTDTPAAQGIPEEPEPVDEFFEFEDASDTQDLPKDTTRSDDTLDIMDTSVTDQLDKMETPILEKIDDNAKAEIGERTISGDAHAESQEVKGEEGARAKEAAEDEWADVAKPKNKKKKSKKSKRGSTIQDEDVTASEPLVDQNEQTAFEYSSAEAPKETDWETTAEPKGQAVPLPQDAPPKDQVPTDEGFEAVASGKKKDRKGKKSKRPSAIGWDEPSESPTPTEKALTEEIAEQDAGFGESAGERAMAAEPLFEQDQAALADTPKPEPEAEFVEATAEPVERAESVEGAREDLAKEKSPTPSGPVDPFESAKSEAEESIWQPGEPPADDEWETAPKQSKKVKRGKGKKNVSQSEEPLEQPSEQPAPPAADEPVVASADLTEEPQVMEEGPTTTTEPEIPTIRGESLEQASTGKKGRKGKKVKKGKSIDWFEEPDNATKSEAEVALEQVSGGLLSAQVDEEPEGAISPQPFNSQDELQQAIERSPWELVDPPNEMIESSDTNGFGDRKGVSEDITAGVLTADAATQEQHPASIEEQTQPELVPETELGKEKTQEDEKDFFPTASKKTKKNKRGNMAKATELDDLPMTDEQPVQQTEVAESLADTPMDIDQTESSRDVEPQPKLEEVLEPEAEAEFTPSKKSRKGKKSKRKSAMDQEALAEIDQDPFLEASGDAEQPVKPSSEASRDEAKEIEQPASFDALETAPTEDLTDSRLAHAANDQDVVAASPFAPPSESEDMPFPQGADMLGDETEDKQSRKTGKGKKNKQKKQITLDWEEPSTVTNKPDLDESREIVTSEAQEETRQEEQGLSEAFLAEQTAESMDITEDGSLPQTAEPEGQIAESAKSTEATDTSKEDHNDIAETTTEGPDLQKLAPVEDDWTVSSSKPKKSRKGKKNSQGWRGADETPAQEEDTVDQNKPSALVEGIGGAAAGAAVALAGTTAAEAFEPKPDEGVPESEAQREQDEFAPASPSSSKKGKKSKKAKQAKLWDEPEKAEAEEPVVKSTEPSFQLDEGIDVLDADSPAPVVEDAMELGETHPAAETKLEDDEWAPARKSNKKNKKKKSTQSYDPSDEPSGETAIGAEVGSARDAELLDIEQPSPAPEHSRDPETSQLAIDQKPEEDEWEQPQSKLSKKDKKKKKQQATLAFDEVAGSEPASNEKVSHLDPESQVDTSADTADHDTEMPDAPVAPAEYASVNQEEPEPMSQEAEDSWDVVEFKPSKKSKRKKGRRGDEKEIGESHETTSAMPTVENTLLGQREMNESAWENERAMPDEGREHAFVERELSPRDDALPTPQSVQDEWAMPERKSSKKKKNRKVEALPREEDLSERQSLQTPGPEQFQPEVERSFEGPSFPDEAQSRVHTLQHSFEDQQIETGLLTPAPEPYVEEAPPADQTRDEPTEEFQEAPSRKSSKKAKKGRTKSRGSEQEVSAEPEQERLVHRRPSEVVRNMSLEDNSAEMVQLPTQTNNDDGWAEAGFGKSEGEETKPKEIEPSWDEMVEEDAPNTRDENLVQERLPQWGFGGNESTAASAGDDMVREGSPRPKVTAGKGSAVAAAAALFGGMAAGEGLHRTKTIHRKHSGRHQEFSEQLATPSRHGRDPELPEYGRDYRERVTLAQDNSRDPSPVDSPSKERSSAALFSSSPSMRDTPTHATHGHHPSIEEISQGKRPKSLHGADDFDSAPTTPAQDPRQATPLMTITEQSPEDVGHFKHRHGRGELNELGHQIKARKRRSAHGLAEFRDMTRSPQQNREVQNASPSESHRVHRLGVTSGNDLHGQFEADAPSAKSRGYEEARRASGRHERPRSLITGELDPDQRPFSSASYRSTDSINAVIRDVERPTSASPRLRREKRSVSSDLRKVSSGSMTRQETEERSETRDKEEPSSGNAELVALGLAGALGAATAAGFASSSTYDPATDKGKARISKMTDLYEGWGDMPGSPRSPSRPPSVRRRQSLQILDLETRLDSLVSENRLLQDSKSKAERQLENVSQEHSSSLSAQSEAIKTRDLYLQQKDSELEELRNVLNDLQGQVARLTEANRELTTKSAADAEIHEQYRQLQAEHAQSRQLHEDSTRELGEMRDKHNSLSRGMESMVAVEVASAVAHKDAELRNLHNELDTAREQIRTLQQQILAARNAPSSIASEVLVERDEDYFDQKCQNLCAHVQQWVLRFSKFSDTKRSRSVAEIKEEKIFDRFDAAILDGGDADDYLSDRVRRRDVFMSVVMTMVFEYIFTRYLFGMDREQRQKLKVLEKTLSEVGPPAAVNRWRATTLTLLSKRKQFERQRQQDTEAVVQEIYDTLAVILPPPAQTVSQLTASLTKVLGLAVDLAVEMRTQRAEYAMLPAAQPTYNTNGDLVSPVKFNPDMMNERSGAFSNNDDVPSGSTVRIVLFPLVVKKGDDDGLGDEQTIVCLAQVLVAREDDKRGKRAISEIPDAMKSKMSIAPSFAMGASDGGMF